MARSRMDACRKLVGESHDNGFIYAPVEKMDCQYARRMAKAGRLVSPLKGLYALPEVWAEWDATRRHVAICRTLSKKHPEWVFCHASAAAIYGLEVAYTDLGVVHVACSTGNYSRSSAQIRRHFLPDIDLAEHDGIPVTSILQTSFDCMRSAPFERALAIADSVSRNYGYSEDDLTSYIKRHPGFKGRAVAEDAARYADGQAENGGESIARARMIELGFEIPKLQVELDDPLELGKEYRADFLWELDDGSELIGELDGKEKYTNPKMTGDKDIVEVLLEERLRESRVSAYKGRRVMRFSFAEVMNRTFFELLLDQYGVPRTKSGANSG